MACEREWTAVLPLAIASNGTFGARAAVPKPTSHVIKGLGELSVRPGAGPSGADAGPLGEITGDDRVDNGDGSRTVAHSQQRRGERHPQPRTHRGRQLFVGCAGREWRRQQLDGSVMFGGVSGKQAIDVGTTRVRTETSSAPGPAEARTSSPIRRVLPMPGSPDTRPTTGSSSDATSATSTRPVRRASGPTRPTIAGLTPARAVTREEDPLRSGAVRLAGMARHGIGRVCPLLGVWEKDSGILRTVVGTHEPHQTTTTSGGHQVLPMLTCQIGVLEWMHRFIIAI